MLKQSKVKYLLLLPSSVVTFLVLFSSYILIFGFEYHHRYRDGYIGPSAGSQRFGFALLALYPILIYLLTWLYNRGSNGILRRLIRSLFHTFVILAVGILVSFPFLFPAYFPLMD